MRNRFHLFTSAAIVLAVWFCVAYVLTTGTVTGSLRATLIALAVTACGLIAGAAGGTAIHALDLELTCRGVARGDACGGARVSLGELPLLAGLGGETGGAVQQPEQQPEPEREAADAAEVDNSGEAPVGAKAGDECRQQEGAARQVEAPSGAPTAATDRSRDCVDSASDSEQTPEQQSEQKPEQEPDRLAAVGARFVADHSAVAITPSADGSVVSGSIERAANPVDFAAFLALVPALSATGVDVSRVVVSDGPDGLPALLSFPVSSRVSAAQEF